MTPPKPFIESRVAVVPISCNGNALLIFQIGHIKHSHQYCSIQMKSPLQTYYQSIQMKSVSNVFSKYSNEIPVSNVFAKYSNEIPVSNVFSKYSNE
jgi:hypothetical protein